MRLELSFSDRVGIASEILTVLAREGLDVVAVEVEPPFIYIDAPDLDAGRFQSVRPALGMRYSSHVMPSIVTVPVGA